MNTTADIFLHELAAIKNYLGAAQDVLKTGSMPDMTQLEKRVGDFCMNLQKADEDVQTECLPKLTALLNEIDATEQGLREWYDAKVKANGDNGKL